MIEDEVVGPYLVRTHGACDRSRAPASRFFGRLCAAPAAPPPATTDTPGQGSCGTRRAQERCGCGGSRSADTAPTAPSFAQPRAPLSLPSGPGSSIPSAPPRTACRLAAPRDHALGHTQLAAGEPARSPVFCRDFLHDLDLEITLGNQLLEPRILGL